MKLRALLNLPQYSLLYCSKVKVLEPIIQKQLLSAQANNVHIESWFKKLKFDPSQPLLLSGIPTMPAQMFKYFDLSTISSGKI